MGKRLDEGAGMLGRWLRNPSQQLPDPIKYNAQCSKCKSTFYGDTQGEADEREAKHPCPKA